MMTRRREARRRWLAAGLVGVGLGCARPAEPARVQQPAVRAGPVEPAGVEPALLERAELQPGDVEEKCRDAFYLARCLQARAHPEVRFAWTLAWNERGAGEDERLRQEVIDRLHADGVQEVVTDSWAWSVLVIASYRQVRLAMSLPHVSMVTVGCAEDDQEFCACDRLRVDQCEAHAFCQEVYGWPNCQEPPTLAGCTRAQACTDAVTFARDPGGVTWKFRSGCRPDQPGWQPLGFTVSSHRCE